MSYVAPVATLGSVLRRHRLLIGLTQARLGSRIGVSTAAVSGWESGTRFPRPSHIAPISEELRIDRNRIVDLLLVQNRVIE